MRKNISTNTNKTIESLTQENIRLYTENTQLKLELSKFETENNIKTNHTKSSTKTKKNTTNKTKINKTTKNIKNNKNIKSNKSTLSEFQQNRENAKTIVANSRKNNVDITEIAKLINKSEPTVRKYIKELKTEGRI